MSRRKFAPRTLLLIELRHRRGISAVSIAGELGTTVERVERVIAVLAEEIAQLRHD